MSAFIHSLGQALFDHLHFYVVADQLD